MKKRLLLLIVSLLTFITVFAGDLKTYERKSLFVFPVVYNSKIAPSELTPLRKKFIRNEIFKMFVKNFERVDFFDIKTDASLDQFLSSADQFIRKNARDITAKRMTADGKFKEAMVTLDDLLKTLDHSYALVPHVNYIKKKINKKKKISYKIGVTFKFYSTKTKKVVAVINETSSSLAAILGTGFANYDKSDLKNLSKAEKKVEKAFRNSFSGVLVSIKKSVRNTPIFKITAVANVVSSNKFGFPMGKDTGIRIDNRYKSFTFDENGKKHMNAYGKIRKVKEKYAEAQVLIGTPEEGDQIEEYAKMGIDIKVFYGMTHIVWKNNSETITDEATPTLGASLLYDLGPQTSIPELYLSASYKAILMKDKYETNLYTYEPEFTVGIATLGVKKKFYMKRVGFSVGAAVGVLMVKNNITWLGNEYELKGYGFGGTIDAGVDFLISPSFYIYGEANLDFFSNPTEWEVDGNYAGSSDDIIDYSAQGFGFNFGISITI